MKSYTLPLSDPQADLETVGGKGMSLAKLAKAGLPVPGGFHVTTEAYQHFVAANNLQAKIEAALRIADPALPATLETASTTIGHFFARAEIPGDLANAIVNAYAALPGSNPTVAVRSSATAEDLPDASFAGQQETYLNINSADQVLDVTKKCWASLWTARAIGYRARQGIGAEGVALAIVVQLLVNAEAAGIMFTANPLNGNRNETVINAAWGLGEAVVGGAVTPDTITVDKLTGSLIARETAEKLVMTVRAESGTEEQPVPNSLQKVPVLSDEQAARLAKYGVEIEELYGMPMDIEWTLEDGKFAIVQARPITTLPEPPLKWVTTASKAFMARGSFAEFVPEPVSPLFATLAVPIAQDATRKMINDFVGITDEESYLFDVVNGYVYVGIKNKYIGKMLLATVTKSKKVLQNSKERWEAIRAKSITVVNKWKNRNPAELSAPELLAGVRELFGATAEYYTVAQSGAIPAASSSELPFSRYYDMLVKRKDDPTATTFLLGFENLPLRAEKSLYDLATWAKDQPELADSLMRTPAETVCAALQSEPVPVPVSGEFATRFADYQAEFGHTLYDLDFAKPVPADDPAPLIDAIKVYLDGKGNDPYERQRIQTKRREQAEQVIINRLGSLRKKWFLKLLKWAQESAPVREDCIADLGLGYPTLRRFLSEFGRRLVASNAIAHPEDIYWLEAQELDEMATALEKGKALPNYADHVERCRAAWRRAREITPPLTIPEKKWVNKLMAHDNPEGDTLKGYGASAGKATAPACVMRGPEDFSLMHPGDVIVAVTTTPAWTPLFAMASAVVTDIGGPLSHSSIVAREYGIPAVMATGVASKRIKTGQMITVDGGTGIISLN
jgi:phosphohistidine swiveling domain-containing protein